MFTESLAKGIIRRWEAENASRFDCMIQELANFPSRRIGAWAKGMAAIMQRRFGPWLLYRPQIEGKKQSTRVRVHALAFETHGGCRVIQINAEYWIGEINVYASRAIASSHFLVRGIQSLRTRRFLVLRPYISAAVYLLDQCVDEVTQSDRGIAMLLETKDGEDGMLIIVRWSCEFDPDGEWVLTTCLRKAVIDPRTFALPVMQIEDYAKPGRAGAIAKGLRTAQIYHHSMRYAND